MVVAYQQGFARSVSAHAAWLLPNSSFFFPEFSSVFPAYLYSLHRPKTVFLLTNDICSIQRTIPDSQENFLHNAHNNQRGDRINAINKFGATCAVIGYFQHLIASTGNPAVERNRHILKVHGCSWKSCPDTVKSGNSSLNATFSP